MPKANGFHNHEQLDPPTGCPAPSLWGELAAGLLSAEHAGRLLRHADECASCAEELHFARRAIQGADELPEQTRQRLLTAREEWQMRFAGGIAAARAVRETNHEHAPGPKHAPAIRNNLLMRLWIRLNGCLRHRK
jgi:hypothetical protein